MENIIETYGLKRSFLVGANRIQALAGVDISCPKGKLIIIRGRSGSGKTTLINILGGLDRPDAGQVLYGKADIHNLSEKELTEWRRKEVGFVFQSFALMPHLTALENVELPQRFLSVPWRIRQERAKECLHLVGLSKRSRHRALELSGGEQQRVAIARAITNHPRLILADEPTGELDYETGMRVMELFRKIVDGEGVTIIVSTHDQAASEFGDIQYIIEDGHLVKEVNQ